MYAYNETKSNREAAKCNAPKSTFIAATRAKAKAISERRLPRDSSSRDKEVNARPPLNIAPPKPLEELPRALREYLQGSHQGLRRTESVRDAIRIMGTKDNLDLDTLRFPH